jgi:NTE family protein
MAKAYDTGLILSGGGARGFAHLGVLQALEELGIRPGVISGVSAGAIVGVFYADGYSPAEIMDMFVEKKLFSLVRFTVPRSGFLKLTGLHELLRTSLRAKTFEDLQIPLWITVTNLNKGEAEYVNHGPLSDMVIASASIPVLFEPHRIGKYQYSDGGVFDVLPVDPVKKACKTLIGVNVNPRWEEKNISGLLKMAEWSFYLRILASVQNNLLRCDIQIDPQELKGYGIFDMSRAREMFDIGYEEARRVLEKNSIG